jgi:hypothetical protein
MVVSRTSSGSRGKRLGVVAACGGALLAAAAAASGEPRPSRFLPPIPVGSAAVQPVPGALAPAADSELPLPNVPELPAEDITPVSLLNEEEQRLLPLLTEERRLLADFGPDSPQVLAVRQRIDAVRAYYADRAPPAFNPAPEPAPLPEPVLAAAAEAAPVEPQRLPVLTVTALAPTAPPVRQAALMPPPVRAKPASNERWEPAKPDAAPSAAAPAPHREQRSLFPALSDDWAASPLAGVGALVAAALLVFFVALTVVARWFGRWFARRLRAELASVLGSNAAIAPRTPAPVPTRVTAERFELGPSYQDEQRLREEAEQQQELGLLQHICNENLKLCEDLERLPAAAE